MRIDQDAVSRALIPLPGQEAYVKRGFWSKIRRLAGKVPFLDRAVACYFAAIDPNTPLSVKATLFAALAYFVVPTDMIPDLIAGFGYTDDLAVLTLAVQAVAPHIKNAHLQRARAVLAGNARGVETGRRQE